MSSGAAQCGGRGVVAVGLLAACWVGLRWDGDAGEGWCLDGCLDWGVGAWGCDWGLLGYGTHGCVELDDFGGDVAELRGAVCYAWGAGGDGVD